MIFIENEVAEKWFVAQSGIIKPLYLWQIMHAATELFLKAKQNKAPRVNNSAIFFFLKEPYIREHDFHLGQSL